MVARVLGSARAPWPTRTSAFGSSGPAVKMPRWRGYFKVRPTARTPGAGSGGGGRGAGAARVVAAVEREGERARAVDRAAGRQTEGLGCHDAAPGGAIACVTVSRSTIT